MIGDLGVAEDSVRNERVGMRREGTPTDLPNRACLGGRRSWVDALGKLAGRRQDGEEGADQTTGIR
jgi:hypothetical protein